MKSDEATRPEPGAFRGGPRILPPGGLADWLGQGNAALLPTDTLPALAAVPAAAAQIWGKKQRPLRKPLILMGADLEQLRQALAVPWRQEWIEQALGCWPGAVTLVLPIPGTLTDFLHPGGGTLGLRVPDCGMTQSLLCSTGPLATTSANLSGSASATTAEEASRCFPELPLLGPLPWPRGSGRASQVLRWDEGSQDWQVLRTGAPADRRSPAA